MIKMNNNIIINMWGPAMLLILILSNPYNSKAKRKHVNMIHKMKHLSKIT